MCVWLFAPAQYMTKTIDEIEFSENSAITMANRSEIDALRSKLCSLKACKENTLSLLHFLVLLMILKNHFLSTRITICTWSCELDS